MFHLLEFMDVEWELDLSKVQERWAEFDNWSQLILKYPVDRVEMITKAPSSGIYRMDEEWLHQAGAEIHRLVCGLR